MTSIQTMEISTTNLTSGSYEEPGSTNVNDAYLIGDVIETTRIPTNTLDQGVTIA